LQIDRSISVHTSQILNNVVANDRRVLPLCASS
jgi:hypothetical protein